MLLFEQAARRMWDKKSLTQVMALILSGSEAQVDSATVAYAAKLRSHSTHAHKRSDATFRDVPAQD